MADYYPLLARALDALPDRTPALRTAVYDRARNALVAQLRSLDPPLSDADIDLERRALDAAIERLEVDYGEAKPAAQAVASSPPLPTAPPPADPLPEPVPASATALPESAGPPPMPAAPAPTFRPPDPEPDLPRPAAIPIAPRRAKPAPEPDPAPSASEPAAEPVGESSPSGPDAGGSRQRPRIEVVAPRAGGSRLVRNAIVGVVLALVIGTIAVAAYLLRDQPVSVQTAEDAEGQGQTAEGDAKFSDRIGGEGQSAERPAPAAGGDARTPATPPVQPDLAVAQRAVLLEENAAQNAQPTASAGRVVWRLESVSGEQGQPLQTAVVATVAFPEAGLSLAMTIQRNLDATLPASHTVSLAFVNTGTGGEKRAVQDVGLLQAKDDENGRGSSVSGLPVRVRENLFLIGLSSLRADVDRNTDLLLHRNWFDIALRYTSGQRAVISFEKGNSGTYVLQRAFEQWR